MYDLAKYARSLIREFGRKDETSVALMWIAALAKKQRDGYLDYFNQLLNRIYNPASGHWQEYVHEHICRIFNSYPKIVSNQKYPGFSMDSSVLEVNQHLKLLVAEIDKGPPEKELLMLTSDLKKLRDSKDGKEGKIFPKRICTVDFKGNVIIRFANLEVPFTYNSCELKEDLAGAVACAILSWRISNPLPQEKKEPLKKKESNPYSSSKYYGYSYNDGYDA